MRPGPRPSKIILIGCGKRKDASRAGDFGWPAKSLYTGSMFKARRRYAEESGAPWWIVSAKYGLTAPDFLIESYNMAITDLAPIARKAWGLRVVLDLLESLTAPADLRHLSIELHMGADYAEALFDIMGSVGMQWAWPLRGMSQGEQMAVYAKHHRQRESAQYREGVQQ